MRPATSMLLAVLPCVLLSGGASSADVDRARIGDQITGLEFKDIRFLTRSLDEFGQRRAFVIVATNNTCPVAKRYMPVLAEMERGYRDRGVQFVALNVSSVDTIPEMAAESIEAGADFPFVKDINLKCTRALGVRRTPEAVVLDAKHIIRYRGRIDDQFRLGGERAKPTQSPLRDAIEDVLAGRAVALAETPIDGCLISEPVPAKPSATPTFAEHVGPIVQRHCQDCHRPNTQAPFSLVTFRDVASQAEMIAEVVSDRRMPPWFASSRHGSFVNRRGLSDSEIETITQWVQGGTPRGDLTKLPKPREHPASRWQIGEPDLITTTPIEHRIPATGYVDYRYTVLPHLFAEDTWVQFIEILPSNPRVVHHANLAFMKLGERPREENFITGRVPGGDPMSLEDGTCVLIPKGSVLGLQIHFTTTGKPETAKISVGLKFPRVPVKKRLYNKQVHTKRFAIPPLAPAYPVTARRELEFDATGVGLFSHMHLRGKDMTFDVRYPGGQRETLLLIPNYNFDWQQSYRWAPGAKKFPKGSTFEVTAHFDNSEFNPYNPDANASVGNGDQTFSEMMYGFYFYTRDDEDLNIKVDPKTGVATAKPPVAVR